MAKSCKSCKFNKRSKCKMIDKYILAMVRILDKTKIYNDGIDIFKSLVLKDIALNEFYCKFYEKIEEEKK